jgi:hypothetical protein
MPGKKRKFVDFEARMGKLAREYPAEIHEPDDTALVVIKTHLLAENYLDSILELAANDPQKFGPSRPLAMTTVGQSLMRSIFSEIR